jgi:hypothetical protein
MIIREMDRFQFVIKDLHALFYLRNNNVYGRL